MSKQSLIRVQLKDGSSIGIPFNVYMSMTDAQFTALDGLDSVYGIINEKKSKLIEDTFEKLDFDSDFLEQD